MAQWVRVLPSGLQPEFKPKKPHSGRREPNLESRPLAFVHLFVFMCVCMWDTSITAKK